MACGYISSNDERLYVALELAYGQVPMLAGANRFPAVKLGARQTLERPRRRDKTGSRTYPGTPAGLRKRTEFELTTYLTGWTRQDAEPGYGPLFQACLGGSPMLFEGGVAAENSNARLVRFAAEHVLQEGQAVTFGGELRFVASIVDAVTVELNAPFTLTPSAGSPIGPTLTYPPGSGIETASIFDFWSPAGAVNRILSGAAIERMRVKVNSDFHEFEFRGLAKDLLDSTSFQAGEGELAEFPAEPPAEQFDYSIVPGHLGQAWLGNLPDRFYTVTEAEIAVENDLEPRSYEFGTDSARCITPGMRTVSAELELFEMNDAATKGLYQAARQQSPIAVMFQLGQQSGQLFGVYLKSVTPEAPEFDDRETRLRWRFRKNLAQGTVNDEVFMAFG